MCIRDSGNDCFVFVEDEDAPGFPSIDVITDFEDGDTLYLCGQVLYGPIKIEFYNADPSDDLFEDDVRIQLSDNSIIVLFDAAHLFDEQEDFIAMNKATGRLEGQNLDRFQFPGQDADVCFISCASPDTFDCDEPPVIWDESTIPDPQ